MDPNKITSKVAEMVNAARDLALESSHQQITPSHLAIAMLDDRQGVPAQALARVGGEEAVASVLRVLKKGLVRQPAVDPPPDEAYLSNDLKKVFATATKLQKAKGDGFLGECFWWGWVLTVSGRFHGAGVGGSTVQAVGRVFA